MDGLRPESLILLLGFSLPSALSWADGQAEKDEQGEQNEKDVRYASRAHELVDQFVTIEAKVVQVKRRVYLFLGRPEMLISAADRITVIGPLAGSLASELPALREALRVRHGSVSPLSEAPRPQRRLRCVKREDPTLAPAHCDVCLDVSPRVLDGERLHLNSMHHKLLRKRKPTLGLNAVSTRPSRVQVESSAEFIAQTLFETSPGITQDAQHQAFFGCQYLG